MITDKPVIIYGVPKDFIHTPVEKARMEKILQGADMAHTPAELSNVLDTCLENPEEKLIPRRKVVKEVFANLGNATHVAVNYILNHIGVTP